MLGRELGALPSPSASSGVGERLKAWRTDRGLAQATVAQMAGMDVKTLGKIERAECVSRRSLAAVETLMLATTPD